MKRCFSCFHEYDDGLGVCPYCGQVEITRPKEPIHLTPGTLLGGRYVIGSFVGAGGFGIVYRAWDTKLDIVVAVKEFYMSQIMTRAEGVERVIINKKKHDEYMFRKERFLAEARNMAKFGMHRNIPNVFEFFEANNTAYIVMELLQGMPLNRYLEQCGGRVNPDFALFIANEVGNALKSLHEAGIIHRDVAPDNIFICTGKEIVVKLMDFGAAKLADETDKVIDIILKPGYSPIEQYDKSNRVGPWSDVYALGATLYMLLTGEKPREATDRKEALNKQLADPVVSPNVLNAEVSESLGNAIMRALSIDIHWRLKSIPEFLNALNGGVKIRTVEQEKKHKKYRRISGVIIALSLLALVGVFVAGLIHKNVKDASLDKATIVVWFIDSDDESKKQALAEVFEDFESKFDKVKIEYRAIEEAYYEDALTIAARNGEMPTLYESTGVSETITNEAISLRDVLGTTQAEECLFLNQYKHYYENYTRIPLAIEVPVAYVITRGPVSANYESVFFENLDDFGNDAVVAFDTRYEGMLKRNFVLKGLPSERTFFVKYYDGVDDEDGHKDKPTSPILLSSTMSINEVRDLVYVYKTIFPKIPEIQCRFVYEWSISDSPDNEIAAAKRLLSWMLGNVYQQKLMIYSRSGRIVSEIPINKECFEKKANQVVEFSPMLEVYKNFRFGEE